MNGIELYVENYNYHVKKKYLNITYNLDLGNVRDYWLLSGLGSHAVVAYEP